LYSTLPLSSKPPPRPVLSSTSPTLGALHTLHVDLLAQFTFPHLEHCQSSAANNPLLFSAAFFPISTPIFFFPIGNPSLGRSALHRLQAVRLAKFIFPHVGSAQVQSPSFALNPPKLILILAWLRQTL